jgi:transglutaminase-like putative cysteine protease
MGRASAANLKRSRDGVERVNTTEGICLDAFLASSEVVDWKQPDVRSLARELAGDDGPVAVAARCFRWVRDEVRHSGDHGDQTVTLSASEVLWHRTGLCYSKSHLLAALLRANGIPAGFGYQRLSIDDTGPPFCLHGINAVALPGVGWYLADARGERPGINTRFDPPHEMLAYRPRLPGERTLEGVWAEPLPVVVAALRRCETVRDLLGQLPDCAD